PDLPPPPKVKGALEGEALEVIEATGGNATVQETDAWGWSNGAQLWWIDNKPGNTLTLKLPVEKAGRYKIEAVFTYAPDYGIANIVVNNNAFGDRDFYDASVRSGVREE